MLDDIIEIVIDIAGDILEAVIRSRRKKARKAKRTKKAKAAPAKEPWLQRSRPDPWDI